MKLLKKLNFWYMIFFTRNNIYTYEENEYIDPSTKEVSYSNIHEEGDDIYDFLHHICIEIIGGLDLDDLYNQEYIDGIKEFYIKTFLGRKIPLTKFLPLIYLNQEEDNGGGVYHFYGDSVLDNDAY